jgi:membrane protein DedA with SNARE-associated domain
VIDRTALYVYLGIFVALLAAGIGFPIPEELPIVTAGALVGHAAEDPIRPAAWPETVGLLAAAPDAPWPATIPWAALALSSQDPHLNDRPLALYWQIMLPVCILGVVISDGLLYGMGRFFGRRVLEMPFMTRLLPPERRQRIEENFHKYGVLVLLFARFLPTIRSPIFIMAGVMRLPFTRFLLADGIYAIPGVGLLFFLAFWFGDQFRDLILRAEGKVERLRPLIILLLIAGVTGYLVSHFLRHPVATGDPREEMPLVGDRVADKIEHPAKPEDKPASDTDH